MQTAFQHFNSIVKLCPRSPHEDAIIVLNYQNFTLLFDFTDKNWLSSPDNFVFTLDEMLKIARQAIRRLVNLVKYIVDKRVRCCPWNLKGDLKATTGLSPGWLQTYANKSSVAFENSCIRKSASFLMVSLNSFIPIPPIGPNIIAAFTWNQANRENKLNKDIKLFMCITS